MPRQRLDTALVGRGLARSRTQAAHLIAARRVTVAGIAADKPALRIDDTTTIDVKPGDDYASRGAYKLIGALDSFEIDVRGRLALDAGASTGGFTDVLLRRGAARVAAVDVGHGQLASSIAGDPRVSAHDGVNLREVSADENGVILVGLGGRPDLIVADLSFISLALVLPQLIALAAPGAEVLPMVKPQFEVGKDRLGAGGVVRDPALRDEAVAGVSAAAAQLGWRTVASVESPLPGPSGNIETFLHLHAIDGKEQGHGRLADHPGH